MMKKFYQKLKMIHLQEENIIEMQIYENNREQNKQEEKLLTTNFEVKVKNRKVEGLIIVLHYDSGYPDQSTGSCITNKSGPWVVL